MLIGSTLQRAVKQIHDKWTCMEFELNSRLNSSRLVNISECAMCDD